eukprot:9473161-Pyramimonas_sp.AAC.1
MALPRLRLRSLLPLALRAPPLRPLPRHAPPPPPPLSPPAAQRGPQPPAPVLGPAAPSAGDTYSTVKYVNYQRYIYTRRGNVQHIQNQLTN